jgi:hypothetical protein
MNKAIIFFILCFIGLSSSVAANQNDTTNIITLQNAEPSPESAVVKLLSALEKLDTAAILNMMVTYEEFHQSMWKEELEKINYPLEYAFEHLKLNSLKGIFKLLNRWGGKQLELNTLRFEQPIKKYKRFNFYDRAKVIVDEKGSEGEKIITEVAAIIEASGKFKIYCFTEKTNY